MKLISIFTGKKKEGPAIVVDVASSSVGAAVVDLESSKPEIYALSRSSVVLDRELSIKEAQLALSTATRKAIETATESGLKRLNETDRKVRGIQHAFCYFSSPWSFTRTKEVTFESKKPVSYTDRFIGRSLHKEEEKVVREIQKERNIKQGGVLLIDRNILRTKLNGYETVDPYSKRANTISATFFMGAVLDSVYKLTEKRLVGVFPQIDVLPHTGSLPLVRVVNDLKPNLSDYLIINVREELTEISLVKERLLVTTTSINTGVNDIIKAIAKSFKISEEAVASYVKMGNESRMTDVDLTELEKTKDQKIDEWYRDVLEESVNISNGHKIQNSAPVLIADDSFISAFEGKMAQKSQQSKVDVITANDLGDQVELKCDCKNDTPLFFESLFSHKVFNGR